jgi:hypothetical protein
MRAAAFAALRAEHRVHHVEADAARDTGVIEDLDRKRRRMDLGGVQAKRRGQDVERSRHASAVDKDYRSAVRCRERAECSIWR